MAVSKEDAVRIAQEFVKARLPADSVKVDSFFAQFEQIRSRARWAVTFERITPPDVVVSPSEVIVLVDETTGSAELDKPI